jgi:hypothetical protein
VYKKTYIWTDYADCPNLNSSPRPHLDIVTRTELTAAGKQQRKSVCLDPTNAIALSGSKSLDKPFAKTPVLDLSSDLSL